MLENNKIQLKIITDEGSRAIISQIIFTGNNNVNSQQLKNLITTKEFSIIRFATKGYYYDPGAILIDQDLLKQYYLSSGYFNFDISNVLLEKHNSEFHLHFIISEGEKFNFGKIDIQNNIHDISDDLITPLLPFKEGEIFNAFKIRTAVKNLKNMLTRHDYAFALINTDFDPLDDEKLLNLKISISEGTKEYVDKINIMGNDRTLDHVIRRELYAQERTPYNFIQISQSQRRLSEMQFFKTVNIDAEETDEPGFKNLNITVTEQPTGSIGLKGGFTTTTGLVASIAYNEKNLFGTGNTLGITLNKSLNHLSTSLNIIKPYLFDTDVTASFRTYKSYDYKIGRDAFASESDGFSTGLSKSLSIYANLGLTYTYDRTRVKNISPLANQQIKQQVGISTKSELGYSLSYTMLDNLWLPTTRHNLSLQQNIAGFGGDIKNIQTHFTGSVSIDNILNSNMLDVSLTYLSKMSHKFAYGGNVLKIHHKFFTGSPDFRGFTRNGLGPRDINTRESLGGTFLYLNTIQLTTPLTKEDDSPLKGVIFTDFGTLFDIDSDQQTNILDSRKLRLSVGVGVKWSSPFGPFGLYFGFPLLSSDEDKIEYISFKVGG